MTTNVTRLNVYVPAWTFPDRLRKARLTAGMTQREFADAIGVPPSRYAQWEAGNNSARNLVEVARRVEIASGVSAAWLLGLIPDPDTPDRNRPTNPCLSGSRVILGPWGRILRHAAAGRDTAA